MSNPAERREVPPEAARALVGAPAEAAGRRVCSVCGRSLRGRQQRVCSGRCRAAQSRGKKNEAEAERNRQVRTLLTEALSAMRQIAVELQGNGSFDPFTRGMISTDEIRQYVWQDDGPIFQRRGQAADERDHARAPGGKQAGLVAGATYGSERTL